MPSFPDNREFAFTILDDTDDTTVENGRPVYDLLRELGLRTTKTVWALDTPSSEQGPYFAAETLQSPAYLSWVHELAREGFEIAFHNASMGSALREKTVEAIDTISTQFPGEPSLHCNHGQNRENLHWGADRYSSPELRGLLALAARIKRRSRYEGHIKGSRYYWEDIAAERIAYVRRFTYLRLDCNRIAPGGPYHDPRKRGIPVWFNTADAANVVAFENLVTEAAVDELCANKGWCIVSTHLGKGFARDGRVSSTTRRVLEHIASLPGWFVPVSTLLDHLTTTKGLTSLSRMSQRSMEYAHILDRVYARLTGRRSPKVASK